MPCDANSPLWLLIEDGPSPHWWLSPSIRVKDSQGTIVPQMTTSGTYSIEALVENRGNAAASDIEVRFYLSPGGTTLPSATPVASGLVDLGAAGSANDKVWASSGNFTVPSSAGHYCIVVEAVDPSDCNPPRNGGPFDPPNRDQVAQRNIEIVTPPPPPPNPGPGGGAGAGGGRQFFTLPIEMASDGERRRDVTVRAVVDNKPSARLLQALGLGDKTKIAAKPGVEIALQDRPALVPFAKGAPSPKAGLRMRIEPRVPSRVFLAVRAVAAEPDGVTIVHVIEEDATGRRKAPLGGRTYVFATGNHRDLETTLKLGKPKRPTRTNKR